MSNKPYVHQPWPRFMFAEGKEPVKVNSPADAEKLGPGWYTADDLPVARVVEERSAAALESVADEITELKKANEDLATALTAANASNAELSDLLKHKGENLENTRQQVKDLAAGIKKAEDERADMANQLRIMTETYDKIGTRFNENSKELAGIKLRYGQLEKLHESLQMAYNKLDEAHSAPAAGPPSKK